MSIFFKYRPSISFGKSGRLKPNEKIGKEWELIKQEETTKYGFYWWFWFPSFSRNDGRFSMEDGCVHFYIHWLCFWGTLYFWRNGLNTKYGQQVKGSVSHDKQ